jgi:ABC-type polysaccharide/polyol phosphate export permease
MSTQAEAHAEAEITQTGGSPRPDGVYGAFTSVGDGVRRATADLLRGARNWELWTSLGWHEIRQRYRRSIIGPFWLTLSMGAMIGGLGFLFSSLFQQNTQDYIPYLALGLIVWALISGLILDACNIFTTAEGAIRQLSVPLSVYVYQTVWRNLIIFAHNMLIYVVVIIIYGVWPGFTALLAIPGMMLLILNGVWVGFLFGALGARFRDFSPIVASFVQVIFFLTPIFWKEEQLRNRPAFVDLNPFAHALDVVRMPLLGQVPPWSTWMAAASVTLGGLIVAYLFFVRFRARIAYWL